MVLPAVLKKRHSLKGCNLVPLIKRIRLGQPTSLKEYARVQKDKKTEGFTLEEIQNNFKDITGETVEDILIMAQRDETLEEARWALHAAIIYANEVGQPRGQELVNPSSSNSTACNDLVASDEQNQQIPIKRKRDMVTESLEDRVASLEKTKKVELVDDLKDKVRTLCMQQKPNDSLILLTVEELAKACRKVKHEDADIFEELARQANRYNNKLNVASLCLSVLGGKASDAITKAISKCLKEKQSETRSDDKDNNNDVSSGTKVDRSPLSNFYSQFPLPYPYVQSASTPVYGALPAYGYNSFNQANRFNRPGGYRMAMNFRPRGACLFCESTDHQVKNCDKMKAAKGK